jgi:hypothetical protein
MLGVGHMVVMQDGQMVNGRELEHVGHCVQGKRSRSRVNPRA